MKNNNPRIVKITRDETKSYHPAVGYTNIVELSNNTKVEASDDELMDRYKVLRTTQDKSKVINKHWELEF